MTPLAKKPQTNKKQPNQALSAQTLNFWLFLRVWQILGVPPTWQDPSLYREKPRVSGWRPQSSERVSGFPKVTQYTTAL